jgi:hypothetical protein
METHSCINDLGINCYGRTEMMKNIKRMLAFMAVLLFGVAAVLKANH